MSNLYYRNPRLMVLTVALILVGGLSSYYVLPRMEDPLLTERAAMVTTRFPGADAERVESLVTEKLEEELQEIDEIKEVRSLSRSGVSTVNIELRDDVYEVDSVWSRIRDKLDDAKPNLPPEAEEPEFEQLDVKAYALIVALAWNESAEDATAGLGEPNYAILRRLSEELDDAILGIPGTEEVDTFGDPEEEIVVEVDPAKLAALGLSVQQVSEQIRASDSKISAGRYRGSESLLLEIVGELESVERIRRIPIQFGSDGQFARLSDFAEVRKGIVEPPSSLALIQGNPAIAVGALVRPSVRVDHWSSAADKVVAAFEDSLPHGVSLHTVFRQNDYVETRLTSLLINLLLGGAAVIIVIFVMMGWRSAIVVGSALPLAALMVLTGMRLLSIPIHQMSITGLIIALGLLIDNAIVIVDEVNVKLRAGATAAQAVARSVAHLALPLLGSTITTALAFAPIALMPGPAGEFVGSIAVSVILAIFSSLFLALTVIPAITAMANGRVDQAIRLGHARRSQDRVKERGEASWWREGVHFPRLLSLYRRTLGAMFSKPIIGIAVGLVLPIAGVVHFGQLPEQFFPPADRDQFQIELELPSTSSLGETVATVGAMREQLLQHDRVDEVSWFIGESAPSFYYNVIPRRRNTASYAQALVQLQTGEAPLPVIRQLQKQLDASFPESRVLVRQLEQGPPFDAPVEVRLFGPDLQVLRTIGDQVRVTMSQAANVVATRADLSETVPKLSLVVDEEEVRLAGLDHSKIANQLNASLEGALGGSVLEETEELPVRVRVSNDRRSQMQSVASLELLGPVPSDPTTHRGIPVSALGELTLTPQSASVPRLNSRRMNEVQAYLTAGVLPATVVSDFQQRLDTSGFTLPPGYSMEFGGESAKRDDAIGNLMVNVGMLMVMMVATLVLSFKSFRMATIIGVVATLSAGLGVGALWLFGYPFGFMAIVGTMGLVGVAINDTIVVLAAIREDEQARGGCPEAVSEVVVRSTRHVVATSLTTMAGFVPLLLAGGGFWPPLAVSIAGGVGGATILALYFAPSAYIMAMCQGCHETEGARELAIDQVEPTEDQGSVRPLPQPELATT